MRVLYCNAYKGKRISVCGKSVYFDRNGNSEDLSKNPEVFNTLLASNPGVIALENDACLKLPPVKKDQGEKKPLKNVEVEPFVPEMSKAIQKKIETPKVEPPKVEITKAEITKVEPKKVETPKVETPKVETPKVEPPEVETPKVEAAKPEVSAPKTEKTPPKKKAFKAKKLG